MLTVRRATPADYATVVRWMAELGVDQTPPDSERWQAQYLPDTIIAELQEGAGPPRSAGYVFYLQTDEDVYIRGVVTDPALRKRGVARALLRWIASQARDRGGITWRLNVKPDNVAAVRLYQSLGMREVHASAALRIDFDLCAKLRAARSVQQVQSPADWAELEARYNLSAGTIAARAERADVVLATRGPRGLRSFAVFDPSFQGSFIFRPADAEDAEALLRAMRERCQPGPGLLQVAVENDEPMLTELLKRGASVQMRFVHYAGELPS